MAAIQVEDVFVHPAHGICRVVAIVHGVEQLSYSLSNVLPNIHSRAKFTVPHDALAGSGFNKIISLETAEAIVVYLRTGIKKESQQGAAWLLAVMIRGESQTNEPLRFAQKRQVLERAIKSLTEELAFVMKCSRRKVAVLVEENLSFTATVNPMVRTLLSDIDPFSDL